jgi:peptidoglycan/LPS O-acetylase OafA/YrhL
MIFSEVNHFYAFFNRNIYWGIPALILVSSLLFLENSIKNNKIINFIALIGEASYVMYLIHIHIVFFIARYILNKIFGADSIFIIELLKIIIAYAVTITFSIIIYKFIDKPVQILFRNMLKTSRDARGA